jgi:hypothetical protein
MDPFVFPKWLNTLRPILALTLLVVPLYVVGVFAFAASPRTTDVGYAPRQPVAYSHLLHAGELGVDCRYCHNTVERAGFAAVPPSQTCMNCHAAVKTASDKLVALRERHNPESPVAGMPVEWVKVHDLPDYAYFNHSAHVRRGVGCVSCHGRVDHMEVVYQAEPLSMGWCLRCHRNPEPNLRPLDKITDMNWQRSGPLAADEDPARIYDIQPSTDCSTCHR